MTQSSNLLWEVWVLACSWQPSGNLVSINPSGNIEIDLSIQHLLGENGTLPVSLQNNTVQCFEKPPVPYQSQHFEGVREGFSTWHQ